MTSTSKPIEILLVEDNLGDIRLAKEAFKESKLHLNIAIARDGDEALNYLYQKEDFAHAVKPDLIILDWNLPRISGEEVLAKVKGDSELKRIPVVVLTSSQAQEDILRSYDLHANCYVTKPLDFEKFMAIVNAIEGFWFSIVKLAS